MTHAEFARASDTRFGRLVSVKVQTPSNEDNHVDLGHGENVHFFHPDLRELEIDDLANVHFLERTPRLKSLTLNNYAGTDLEGIQLLKHTTLLKYFRRVQI